MPERTDRLRRQSGTPAPKGGHNRPLARLVDVALTQQKALGLATTPPSYDGSDGGGDGGGDAGGMEV